MEAAGSDALFVLVEEKSTAVLKNTIWMFGV
jgi:hypothetical protein